MERSLEPFPKIGVSIPRSHPHALPTWAARGTCSPRGREIEHADGPRSAGAEANDSAPEIRVGAGTSKPDPQSRSCRRDRGHPPRVVLGEKRRWQTGQHPEGSKLDGDFLPGAWLARENVNSSGRSGVRDVAACQESDECSGCDSRAPHVPNRSPPAAQQRLLEGSTVITICCGATGETGFPPVKRAPLARRGARPSRSRR